MPPWRRSGSRWRGQLAVEAAARSPVGPAASPAPPSAPFRSLDRTHRGERPSTGWRTWKSVRRCHASAARGTVTLVETVARRALHAHRKAGGRGPARSGARRMSGRVNGRLNRTSASARTSDLTVAELHVAADDRSGARPPGVLGQPAQRPRRAMRPVDLVTRARTHLLGRGRSARRSRRHPRAGVARRRGSRLTRPGAKPLRRDGPAPPSPRWPARGARDVRHLLEASRHPRPRRPRPPAPRPPYRTAAHLGRRALQEEATEAVPPRSPLMSPVNATP